MKIVKVIKTHRAFTNGEMYLAFAVNEAGNAMTFECVDGVTDAALDTVMRLASEADEGNFQMTASELESYLREPRVKQL